MHWAYHGPIYVIIRHWDCFFLLVVEFPKAFGALRYLGQTDRQTDRQTALLCSDGGGGGGGGGSGGEESR
jgi:hypothetical protein